MKTFGSMTRSWQFHRNRWCYYTRHTSSLRCCHRDCYEKKRTTQRKCRIRMFGQSPTWKSSWSRWSIIVWWPGNNVRSILCLLFPPPVSMSLFFCTISFHRRPVKLKDFADHYRRMAADSDFRFSEEFDCLKHVGRDQPCCAADLPVNRPKNRFTNILPYDHSRFKLLPTDDEEGSDYINSNYVPVR